MKAKTIEIPTAMKLLLLVLITVLTYLSITNLQAAEITKLAKAEDTKYFENSFTFNHSMTSKELLKEIDTESKRLAQIQRIEYEKEQQRLAQIKAEEEAERARQQAEQARLAAELARLQAEELRFQETGVCATLSFRKTYMDYRSIAQNSTQMSIIRSQTTINEEGLVITADGFIGVALGSRYGNLGDKFRLTTDTGQVIKVIKVDAKADAHTQNGCHDASGAMVEFVIDIARVSSMYPQVTFSGDFNTLYKFNGNIVKVEKYN